MNTNIPNYTSNYVNNNTQIPNCQDILLTNTTDKICNLTKNFTWCPVFMSSGWKLNTDNKRNSKGTCSRN